MRPDKKVLLTVQELAKTTSGRLVLTGVAISVTAITAVTIGAGAALNKTIATDDSLSNPSYSTGSVDIRFGNDAVHADAGDETHTLDVGATGLVPGDTMQRVVNIHNTGSVDLASLVLNTTEQHATPNLTDATAIPTAADRLQITIDACTANWVQSGPPYTYTCADGGGPTSIQTITPSLLTNKDLGSTIRTAGNTVHYRITLTLPSSNTISAGTSTIRFAFTATQRAATDK